MRSFLAALRSLVLPYGATTGPRIILDGIKGVIKAFGQNGSSLVVDPSGTYPIIQFVSPDGTNTAYINAPGDANGVPQIGINSGKYASTYWAKNATGRLFFTTGSVSELGIVNDTQSAMGGNFKFGENFVQVAVYNAANVRGPYFQADEQIGYLGLDANRWIEYSLAKPFLLMSPAMGGGWRNLTKLNGWVDRPGTNYNVVSYTMRPDGWVAFRGSCQGGVSTDGTQIGSVPSLFAPLKETIRGVVVDQPSGGTTVPRVSIRADGLMFIWGTGPGPIYFEFSYYGF